MQKAVLALCIIFLAILFSCAMQQTSVKPNIITDKDFANMDQQCYIPLTKKLKKLYNEEKSDPDITKLELSVSDIMCDMDNEVSIAHVFMNVTAFIETESFTGVMNGSFILELWCNFDFCEIANTEILEVTPIKDSKL